MGVGGVCTCVCVVVWEVGAMCVCGGGEGILAQWWVLVRFIQHSGES